MKKEKLKELGLTEEQATAVINEYSEVIKSFVPKTRLDEVINERNGLKDQVSERDKQIETLKGSAGDNQALKDQIAELQNKNAEAVKEYKANLDKIRIDNAVSLAINGAKAKNEKAVRALLDLAKAKADDNGKIEGLEDQITALKKSDPYLFEAEQQQSTNPTIIKGGTPKDGAGVNPPEGKAVKDMNYLELCDFMAQGGKVE